MIRNFLTGAGVAVFLFSQPVAAETALITFETSEDARATTGAEATNLYVSQGVRFPTRPTIQRDGANQILQQGEAGTRPDPLPDRITCSPLRIEFNSAMGVREVRMRIINRHLRSYSVRAFSGSIEVDVNRFTTTPVSGPPYPPLLPYRDILLRSSGGEGSITRIIANPPSDCFDLMVIDNLSYATLYPIESIGPVPDEPRPNRYSIVAYEVTQGVMSRLTRPGVTATSPDTRLMALPGKRLKFVEGRNTAVRFFVGASETVDANYNANLRVAVQYRDGTSRTKTISENTTGGRIAPVVDRTLSAQARRRALVKRRARVDQSLDYVIPGRFLDNARSMRLQLSALVTGAVLATVDVQFVGPYRLGLNIARVNGIGRDASVGTSPGRASTNLATQFIEDMYPITGRITARESGVLTMNTGSATNCFAFLAALDAAIAGTAAAAPIPGVNFWTNTYFTQSPPGCGGLGWYNAPGAMTNLSFTTAAHEVSHNVGINHVTRLHNEDQGGASGDWEPWPYTHGSIGAVDETQNFNDGVFGVVLNPDAASVVLDMITNWGNWTIGPISPCRSTTNATLFAVCTAADTSMTHDYMSYGPRATIPVWGTQNWISDINYHRLIRWFEDCRQLDPPNRFMTTGTTDTQDTTGECNGAGSLTAGAAGANSAGSAPRDAIIFSGTIDKENMIRNFRLIRKLAAVQSFANPFGTYRLLLRSADGSIRRSIPFAEKIAPGEVDGGRAFTVVVPFEPDLAEVAIEHNQATIFSLEAANLVPVLTILRPKGREIWRKGKQRIEWNITNGGKDAEVYIQYSPDKGTTWIPLALIRADQNYLDVNVEDLVASNNALLYASASNGLASSSDITKQVFAVGPKAKLNLKTKAVPVKKPSKHALNFKEDCLAFNPSAISVRKINGSWKIVDGNHWIFDFQDKADEAQQSHTVIKDFGFDHVCYVGRPGPSMTYLKKGVSVPGGSSQGLDCITFDTSSTNVRSEGNQWLLSSSNSRMAMFPNETEARNALSVIKTYGLNRQCYVGRPDPSFVYWLSGP